MTADPSTDLTIDELIARWRRRDGRPGISRGTLANWRSKRTGPPFRKIGSLTLYPLAGVEEYERRRTVDTRWWKPVERQGRDAPSVEIDPFS